MAQRKIPRLRPEGTVDTEGAAQLLGISRFTLFKYKREEPDFPEPVGKDGHHMLYSREAILEWRRRRLEQG